ncbi:MAG TPA: NAD(P)H-binding protein [Longimicrobiales bacterium]|nr:NAD(P)H-binding protein [Longimicrobiales bacterium]
MPTAFIAGATGYTGRHLVRRLSDWGVDTVAHVRPDSPRLDQWRRRFGVHGARVDATPWREDALTATLARISPGLVFAVLGTTRVRARRSGLEPEKAYLDVDYGLTTLLLRATRRAAPSARFIYLSAAGAGAPRGAYMEARARAERDIQASGLAHVIARPSFITGPDREERRPLERAAAATLDAALAVAGRLGARRTRERYRSTDAATLAHALVALAMDPAAGGVYESEALRKG